jgi:ketosteroid isomerase-like protein
MSDADAVQPVTPAAALAHAYLVALQAKDKDAILPMLTDDFMLEVPFNRSGTNDLSDSWRGKEDASAKYDDAFRRIMILKYRDIVITPAADPNVAFLEAWGTMEMANGRPYDNRYIFRFDVQDGRIRRIREYVNPNTMAIASGVESSG